MPDHTLPIDDSEEVTDPEIVEIEPDAFISTPRAYESTVSGIILLVTARMAETLLTQTLPNKGWVGEGVSYEGITPPPTLRALLFRHATYSVKKGAGAARTLEVHKSTPNRNESSASFALQGGDVRAVLAYRQNVSWVYRP